MELGITAGSSADIAQAKLKEKLAVVASFVKDPAQRKTVSPEQPAVSLPKFEGAFYTSSFFANPAAVLLTGDSSLSLNKTGQGSIDCHAELAKLLQPNVRVHIARHGGCLGPKMIEELIQGAGNYDVAIGSWFFNEIHEGSKAVRKANIENIEKTAHEFCTALQLYPCHCAQLGGNAPFFQLGPEYTDLCQRVYRVFRERGVPYTASTLLFEGFQNNRRTENDPFHWSASWDNQVRSARYWGSLFVQLASKGTGLVTPLAPEGVFFGHRANEVPRAAPAAVLRPRRPRGTVNFSSDVEVTRIEPATGEFVRVLRFDVVSSCLDSWQEVYMTEAEMNELEFKAPALKNLKTHAVLYSDQAESGCRGIQDATLEAECETLKQELRDRASSCMLFVKPGYLWSCVQGYLFLHMIATLFLQIPYFDFCVSVPFLNSLSRVLAITGGTTTGTDNRDRDPWHGLYHFVVFLYCCRTLPEEQWDSMFPLFFQDTQESKEFWRFLQRCFAMMPGGSPFFLDHLILDPDIEVGSKEYENWLARFKKPWFDYKAFVPDLPDPRYATLHDTFGYFREVRCVPKVHPPFASTWREEATTWGGADGDLRNTTPENMVQEAACCLVVDIFLDPRISLSGTLGNNFMDYIQSGLEHCRMDDMHSCEEWKQIRFQCIGEQFLNRLRPVNVLHPHLRAQFEFHCGRLLDLVYYRREQDTCSLANFLQAVGIKFAGVEGYAPSLWSPLAQTQQDHSSAWNIYMSTSWGERVSPAVWEGVAYCIHSVCPFAYYKKHPCLGNQKALGLGTVCHQWHPFEKKWGQALKAQAQAFLEVSANESRGSWSSGDPSKLENPGYGRQVAGKCGFSEVAGGAYHSDSRQTLQLNGLPRFMPRLMFEDQRKIMREDSLCGFAACSEQLFSAEDLNAVLTAESAVKQFHRDICQALGET